jgi:hypothetical protein
MMVWEVLNFGDSRDERHGRVEREFEMGKFGVRFSGARFGCAFRVRFSGAHHQYTCTCIPVQQPGTVGGEA